jgi:ABC-type lipoprotein release transport system permease subunit
MLFKTALLSLFSHKSKTILLLVILSFGAFLTMTSFSLMFTFTENLRKGLTESVSGDIVIHSSLIEGDIDIILPSPNMPTIEDFDNAEEVLDNMDEVKYYTPLIKSGASITDPETNELDEIIPTLGVRIDDYFNIFKNAGIIEGQRIPEGETGIIISTKYIENVSAKYKDDMKVGNTIKIASFTKAGAIRIVNAKIWGILDLQGSEWGVLNNLMDFKTAQRLMGYDPESKIKSLEQMIAIEKNRDLLFSEDADDFDQTSTGEDDPFADVFSTDDFIEEEGEVDEAEVEKEQQIRESIDEEELSKKGTGETQYIVLRLHDHRKINQTVKKLNDTFSENGYNYKAVPYTESSGNLGAFIFFARIIIISIIIILQVISIIIITNTVLMSVLERVNEIGTMRAIGAQRGYIFSLIFTESFILALISSIIGIGVSLLLLWLVGLMGIEATNLVTAILFNGQYLHPITHIIYVLISIGILVVTTFLATLYPVRIATKVSPLEAINKE